MKSITPLDKIISVHIDGDIYETTFWDGDKRFAVDQVDSVNLHHFDYQELVDYITAHPELVDAPLPKIITMTKEDMAKDCDRYLEEEVLNNGFPWNGYTIRCDAVSQQNATGFMTAIAAGMNPFPIVWRTIENVNITFTDVTEFQPFAEIMMGFINQKFQEKWVVKDNIASAATVEEANTIYENYVKS